MGSPDDENKLACDFPDRTVGAGSGGKAEEKESTIRRDCFVTWGCCHLTIKEKGH